MLWLMPYELRQDGNRAALHAETARRLTGKWLDQIGLSGELLKTESGKPYLRGRPDLNVSISHCDGLVVCALERRPVGIDAEKVRAFSPLVARRVCSGQELCTIERSENPEHTFFQIWTLKESLGKALGVGLSYSLREVEFTVGDRFSCNVKGFKFALYEKLEGFVVALCRQVDTRPQIGGNR